MSRQLIVGNPGTPFLSFAESSVFSLFAVFLFFGSVGDEIVHEWLTLIRIVVTRLLRGE